MGARERRVGTMCALIGKPTRCAKLGSWHTPQLQMLDGLPLYYLTSLIQFAAERHANMHAASHAILCPPDERSRQQMGDEFLRVLRILGPEKDLLNPHQHCTQLVMKLTVGCDSQKLRSTTLKSTVRAEILRSLWYEPHFTLSRA